MGLAVNTVQKVWHAHGLAPDLAGYDRRQLLDDPPPL